jgi:hypothetical protein
VDKFGLKSRRICAAGSCALAALIWAEPALAGDTFPAALDAATVRAWLRRETGAAPDQVVAISASAATRILSVEPTGPGRRRVMVEAQALSAAAAARSGVLAWRMPLDVDCATGRVRVGPTTGYASRRAVGPGAALRDADPDWRIAPAGSQLDSLRNAACAMPSTKAKPVEAAAPRVRPIRRLETVPATLRPATPARPVAIAAQVISSPERAEAAAALRRLTNRQGEAMSGLQTQVSPAEVRGRTTYRGLVTGFASRDAAAAFCRALSEAQQACFLRQAPARP